MSLPGQGAPVPQGEGELQVLVSVLFPLQFVGVPQLSQVPGIHSDQFPSETICQK